MANIEDDGTFSSNAQADNPPSELPTTKWQRIKRVLIRTEKEVVFLKGLGIVSLAGTLIGAYLHNLSAYHDRVASLAEKDLAEATQAFTDASAALTVPLSLQERLIFDYYAAVDAKSDTDPSGYLTTSAQEIYKEYTDAYTKLRDNYNMIARNMQIYLDWAGDVSHDSADAGLPNADPISVDMLKVYGFKCDRDMPAFGVDKTTKKELSQLQLTLKNDNSKSLDINWKSAKHNAMTIYYCFSQAHEEMAAVRQWASKSEVDPTSKANFISNRIAITGGQDNQLLRLNTFMGLAMNAIENIRVKYRPSGFLCSVPGLSELISAVGQISNHVGRGWCTPIRTSTLAVDSLS